MKQDTSTGSFVNLLNNIDYSDHHDGSDGTTFSKEAVECSNPPSLSSNMASKPVEKRQIRMKQPTLSCFQQWSDLI